MSAKNNNQRIAVTGGEGVLGRLLVKQLRSRGHEVLSIDQMHRPDEHGLSLRSDDPSPGYVRCDVSSYRQIERVLKQFGPFDYVYHAAAEFGRWNGEDFYEQLWNTNVVGTKHVLRLQEDLGFKLIHFSSSEVYGDWPDIMVETVMDKYSIKQMNDYAMSKWVNEMQVNNSRTQFDTKSVVVRLFNTYGPGEYYSPYRSVNCRFVYCALKEIPWVVFTGYERTSTYVADAVSTLANIVDNFKAGEVYNISSSDLHTVEELSQLVIEATGADPSLAQIKDEEVLTTRSKKVNATKAEKDLGHKSTVTLKEGVEKTVAWMREVYRT